MSPAEGEREAANRRRTANSPRSASVWRATARKSPARSRRANGAADIGGHAPLPPARQASSGSAASPSVITDWTIRETRDGFVYVQGHGDVYQVVPDACQASGRSSGSSGRTAAGSWSRLRASLSRCATAAISSSSRPLTRTTFSGAFGRRSSLRVRSVAAPSNHGRFSRLQSARVDHALRFENSHGDGICLCRCGAGASARCRLRPPNLK